MHVQNNGNLRNTPLGMRGMSNTWGQLMGTRVSQQRDESPYRIVNIAFTHPTTLNPHNKTIVYNALHYLLIVITTCEPRWSSVGNFAWHAEGP